MKLNANASYSYGVIKKIGKTSAEIKIGRFCSIAGGVTAIMTGHPLDRVSTYPFDQIFKTPGTQNTVKGYGDLIIEHDVYIGQNVTLFGGITVHTGAVIGAGSIVRESVPAYAVVTGNPAEFRKYRVSSYETQKKLLRSHWWDLPIEEILAMAPYLTSNNYEAVIRESEAAWRRVNNVES